MTASDWLRPQTATVTTKLDPDAYKRLWTSMRGAAEQLTPWQTETLRTLYATGYRRAPHVHPGPLDWRTRRVEHARARRLYAQRLQRDRRRVRAGRAPILRSVRIQLVFPNVRMRRAPASSGAFSFQVVAAGELPR